MRKYIIGLLIGFALAFSVSAYADDIKSLVGRSIEGEFPVTIDGKALEKKALVIDGTSYVPLRVFGEAIGYESSFSADLGITFKKSGGNSLSVTNDVYADSLKAKQEQDQMNEANSKLNDKYLAIGKLQGQINSKKGMLKFDQNDIDDLNRKLVVHAEMQKDMTPLALDADKVQVDNINTKIQTNKDDMTKLQTDIDNLQSQIDAINATITSTP